MLFRLIQILCFLSISLTANANSYYCPQNHQYVHTGMTMEQVLQACGKPLTVQDPSNSVIKEYLPVKQIIYTKVTQGHFFPGMNPNLNGIWTANSGSLRDGPVGSVYPGINAALYYTWSLPAGAKGVTLQVDLIDDKVVSINLNGTETKAMNICGEGKLKVGDNERQVLSACGMPDKVNNTFTSKTIPSNKNPELWVYQVDQYQPRVQMTFVNGVLKYIN